MTRKWLSVVAVAATLTTLLGFAPLTGHAQTPSPTPKMAHKMPMRDAKGRFMKASPSPKPAMSAKKMNMPMRNAKGQFVKAPSTATTRKMPMRDAKGRFMKAAPMASPMPKP